MPERTFRPLLAIAACALTACVPNPAGETIDGTPVTIGGAPSGAVATTEPAALGDPEFPTPRAVPSRAGELKGVVKGPKLGLIKSLAAAVLAKPTEGLLATAQGYRLAGIADNYQALAGVKVVITDDKGQAFSEEVQTNDLASFSFKGFLPQTKLMFVKASYAEADQDVTLLAASTFPQKAETLEIELTPATTLVAKKAIEMVRLGGISGDGVPPAMIKRMATELEAVMTTRALVAAAILPDGKAADAFDTMVKDSPALKEKLTALATEAGAEKFLDKTPVSRTNLYGKVYDATGQAVASGKVRVKSLNPARPFDKTFDVLSGQYSATDVPSEVQVEITASRDGWTSRTRVEALAPTGQNRADFGGSEDAAGSIYFLSNSPEIVAVKPEDGAVFENGQVSFTLELSEPLDETNRKNFETSLRVIPSSVGADSNPGDEFKPVAIADSLASKLLLTKLPYSIGKDSAFLGSETVKTKMEWNAEGTAITVTFNAPLITSKEEDAIYNIALFNMGVSIKDAEGNRLGTDTGGFFTNAPETYGVWCGTFKDSNLTWISQPMEASARWLATHHLGASFAIAKDEAIPQLLSVAVKKETDFTRIELTFNEPMAAYAGGEFSLNNVLPPVATQINYALRNFTFAVAETEASLAAVPLDGAAAQAVAASSAVLTSSGKWAKELYFSVTKLSQATMTVDPAKPAVVRLDLKNENDTPFRFPANLKVLKARVGSNVQTVNVVADPAGNMIDDETANGNILTGAL